jgi:hypothetical protein
VTRAGNIRKNKAAKINFFMAGPSIFSGEDLYYWVILELIRQAHIVKDYPT